MKRTEIGIRGSVRAFVAFLCCWTAFQETRLLARPTETISTDVTPVDHYEAQGGLGLSDDVLHNNATQLFSLFNWGMTPSSQFEIKFTDDFLNLKGGRQFEVGTSHIRSLIQVWSDPAEGLSFAIQPEVIFNSHLRGGVNPDSVFTYGNPANLPRLNEALTLAATKQFGANTYWDFNVEYTDVSRFNSTSSNVFVGLDFRQNLPDAWQLMGEIYSGVPSYKIAGTLGVVDLALNYTFKSGLKPDVLVGVGLNKTSPVVIFETGFTYDW